MPKTCLMYSRRRRTMRLPSVVVLCIVSHILGCIMTANLIYIYQTGTQLSAPVVSVTSLHNSESLLYVIILSGPSHYEHRTVLRKTWLSDLTSYPYKFVVGTKGLDFNSLLRMKVENMVHKDLLLLEDFTDSYDKLTSKVLKTFGYLKQKNFKFLLKCDDDTFVNTKAFIEALRTLSTSSNSLYWGFFRGNANVKLKGPWKDNSWNLCDKYLPYALGGGYVLSKDLVVLIASNGERWRQFKSEDVSVGAWLAAIDIYRKHDNRFDTEYRSRGCSNDFLVMHKRSPEDMLKMHFNIQMSGVPCDKEVILLPGYNYNWSLPPSQCCKREF